MKRKEMIEFAQDITLRLYDLGYLANIQEAISTNSVYVHSLQSQDTIRVSDHGVNNGSAKYNFLPSQKTNSTFKKGKYYYPMTAEGIEEFLMDYNGICPIDESIKEDISIVEEQKTYIIRHKITNSYLIENSTALGRGMARLIFNNKENITQDEVNLIHMHFRINLNSAQVFKGIPDVKAIIFNDKAIKTYDKIILNQYEYVEVIKNNKTSEIKIKE